ncbi:DUF4328 domain-containing protein [Microbacterium azadirachtae]|uniref:DUF4328 domain-containing protein n=1 Tax=Microbacterium azadirachtae TaxID=582680 RepID=UPI003F750FCA
MLVAAAISTWDIVTFDTYSVYSAYDRYVDTDAFNAFVWSETASTIVSFGSLSVYVATAVCWVVWQYRAASSLPPDMLRRTPGWHVGSWFVPVVSLWFPFQNVTDLTRASRARVSDGVRRAWWTLWIASVVTSRLVYALSVGYGNRAGGMIAELVGQVVTDLLAIAGAVVAWIIVARITDAIVDPQSQREHPKRAHDFG